MDGDIHRQGQDTPDACSDGQESREAQVAFTMTPHSAVVLPLFSESGTLMWVPLNQVEPLLDNLTEVVKAFHSFPYLTEKQSAALARRCYLQPDQVKAWFMVQRLRYGISWDSKDIREVRREFKSRRAEVGKANLRTEEVIGMDESQRETKRTGKVVKERVGCMMGEMAWDQCGEVQRARAVKKMAVSKRSGDDEGISGGTREVVQIRDQDERGWKSAESALSAEQRRDMMRRAFCDCQYPDRKGYDLLASRVGIPRQLLAQWYRDIRYRAKKRRLGWMSQEQQQRVQANIGYQQAFNMQKRAQQRAERQRRAEMLHALADQRVTPSLL